MADSWGRSMSAHREFTEQYLVQAARPTVDLIQDAVEADDHHLLQPLIEQFHEEVCAMLFGYLSWPKVIRRNVELLRHAQAWHEMDTVARQCLSEELLPARQLFSAWDESKNALLAAAEQNNAEKLIQGSQKWHAGALAAHDAYMNYAAVLISELTRRLGPESMQQTLTEVMDVEAMGIRPDMRFRERVERLIKFTRMHLLPFKLVEDDEKMTFIADPCPSGGRQVLAGLYQEGSPGEVIETRSPATYNRSSLPAYCCHESAMEAASIRRFGSPVFIVDPADQLGLQPCHVYVYKEPENIPSRYYHRLGLTREGDLIARG